MTPLDPTPYATRPATDGLNPLLHEPNRLGILTSLLSHRDGLSFTELKDRLSLTDGNLSRHLSTLQENGLVDIRKSMNGRRPLTTRRPPAILGLPGTARRDRGRRPGRGGSGHRRLPRHRAEPGVMRGHFGVPFSARSS